MPTPLSITHQFEATPAAVFTLFADRSFVEGRLTATGGIDPAVLSLDTDQDSARIVTRQSIPASVLPSMVAAMIPGDPVTERTENWRPDGGGYAADFTVVIKGAPATVKGTMELVPSGSGSTLTVTGQAAVPIPLFGGKVESIVVSQIESLLIREAAYTAKALASEDRAS